MVTPSRGFTLIELLVVLLIIGVMIGVAVLSGGTDPQRTARQEARRIAALLGIAAEQAVLEGRQYGAGFARSGYRFYRLDDGEWGEIADDKLLRPRRLPREVELSLEVESRRITLSAERVARPQVLLYSSDERTIFELEVTTAPERNGYSVSGGSFGPLAVEALSR